MTSLTIESKVRKVLVYRLGSLGDTVVALPCFRLIAGTFPNAAERVLLANIPVAAKAPASAAVLGGSGLVHGYMRYTVGKRSPGELLRLNLEIRRFRPDVLIYPTLAAPIEERETRRALLPPCRGQTVHWPARRGRAQVSFRCRH